MKTMFVSFGAVLAAALAAPTAQAQNFGRCVPQAPDCCGPGYYAPNWYGMYYGPNYNLYPGYGPYNGPVGFPSFNARGGGQGGFGGAGFGAGGPGGPGGGPGVAPPLSFPAHPFARSPRDFFMVDDESARPPVPSGYGFSGPVAPPPPPSVSTPVTPPPVPR